MLIIAGRTGEFINGGGVKVNPRLIEEVLLSIDGIVEAAVSGVPDNDGLAKVCAAIVTKAPIEQEAMRGVCVRRLGPATPFLVLPMAERPRNENGKVLIQALVDFAAPYVLKADAEMARAARDQGVSAPSEGDMIVGKRRPSRTALLAILSAFLGWMFDSMDLNLFTLVMVPSVCELSGHTEMPTILHAGGAIVALKILGWGLGGVVFGVVIDRLGRTKTLVWTILIYACFTALSGLAQTMGQLGACQFMAGIGIGGE